MMPQQTNSASQLPFTQAANVINGSNSKQLVSNRVSNVAMAPTNLNAVFQSMDGGPCDTRVVNMSNLHASYCGPFVNPVLDQSIYQLELESMLVKDKADVLEQSLRDERAKRTNIELGHKAEMEQARAQYQELMRQMEKAAKDYAKLMHQIDADQEETAQLREKVRSQECRIESLKLQEIESADKLAQFQTENLRLSTELKEAQLKIQKMAEEYAKTQNASTKTCQSGLCEQRVSEFEETIQKKSLVINDMARKLGGIELQNKELVQELKDRNEAHQQRLTDLKAMFKQENKLEQEKNEQLQRQVTELKSQLEEMRKRGVESCRSTKDIGISTFDQQQLIKFFDAQSSPIAAQKVQEPMVIRSNVGLAAMTTRNIDDKVDFSGNQRVVQTMNHDQDAPSILPSSRNVSPGASVQRSPIQDRDNSADSSKSGQRRRRLRNERMSSQKDILSDFARSTKNLRDGFKLPTARDNLVQFSREFGVDLRQSIEPQPKPSQNLGQMSERSASRLRQPTLISKSPGLTATLEMIEQRTSCLNLQTNESIEVSANPFNKISSMTGLTSRQARPLQTNSQSILQVAPQDFTKRHQTPNSSTMVAHRPSLTTMSVKSMTNQNREATPRRTYAQPLPSARGPPAHLVNRLDTKTGKFTPGAPAGAEVKRLTQSASSTNVHIKRTYDNKRNNLMTKYATNFERKIGKDQLNQARSGSGNDSEHLIDIMLSNHIPDTATDRNIKLSELDASEHSIQFVGTRHSPNVRQSFDVSNIQHTPTSRNNVLKDNTNGLSTMKEKLKSIQDNKQLLEKKIQEYEQKLQKMHSKRNSRKSIMTDENVSSLYVSQTGNSLRNADSSEISTKLTARKTPTPNQTAGFRNCMVNNVPNQPKFQSQLNSQPSTRSMFNNKY